jgi:hypothetical protein
MSAGTAISISNDLAPGECQLLKVIMPNDITISNSCNNAIYEAIANVNISNGGVVGDNVLIRAGESVTLTDGAMINGDDVSFALFNFNKKGAHLEPGANAKLCTG